MSVLPGTGAYKTQNIASANAELNKNLRRLNDTACCLLSAELTPDTEFVPVYEYKTIVLEGFQDGAISPGSRFTYTISGTSIVLNVNYFTAPPSLCPSGPAAWRDDVQYFAYSDSTGVHIVDPGTEFITIPFVTFSDTVIKARVHLGFASGFKITYNYEITVDSSGVPSITALGLVQNNSNSGNVINYYLPKQNYLEVWQNGVFIEYLDPVTHSNLTPTCYLSYNPVPPFGVLDFELEPVSHNTPELVYMSGASTLNIPANSANNVSITIKAGTTSTITVDAITATVGAGFSTTFSSSSLISKDIDVQTFVGDTAIVIIKKP
jgi:hypothetical protein